MSRPEDRMSPAFDQVRTALNRWRADKAPFLSRDEAVLMILSQWLGAEGYLPADPFREPKNVARGEAPGGALRL